MRSPSIRPEAPPENAVTVAVPLWVPAKNRTLTCPFDVRASVGSTRPKSGREGDKRAVLDGRSRARRWGRRRRWRRRRAIRWRGRRRGGRHALLDDRGDDLHLAIECHRIGDGEQRDDRAAWGKQWNLVAPERERHQGHRERGAQKRDADATPLARFINEVCYHGGR